MFMCMCVCVRVDKEKERMREIEAHLREAKTVFYLIVLLQYFLDCFFNEALYMKKLPFKAKKHNSVAKQRLRYRL